MIANDLNLSHSAWSFRYSPPLIFFPSGPTKNPSSPPSEEKPPAPPQLSAAPFPSLFYPLRYDSHGGDHPPPPPLRPLPRPCTAATPPPPPLHPPVAHGGGHSPSPSSLTGGTDLSPHTTGAAWEKTWWWRHLDGSGCLSTPSATPSPRSGGDLPERPNSGKLLSLVGYRYSPFSLLLSLSCARMGNEIAARFS